MGYRRIFLVLLAFVAPALAAINLSTPADTVNWRKLLTYSLFGADSLRLEGSDTTDATGYLGSNGDFIMHFNQNRIAAPVAVRGNLRATTGGLFEDHVIVGGYADDHFSGLTFMKSLDVWGEWYLDQCHHYYGVVYTNDVSPTKGSCSSFDAGFHEGATPPHAIPDSLWIPTASVTAGSGNCTISLDWNGSSCAGWPAGRADSILKPGHYGDLVLQSNVTIYLDSGEYHFNSITLGNGGDLYFLQPNGARSEVYVQNFIHLFGNSDFGPSQAFAKVNSSTANANYDSTFLGGTVLLYSHGSSGNRFQNTNTIWATAMFPNDPMVENGDIGFGTHLYGQLFAKAIDLWPYYNGGGESGRFIPYYPEVPTISLVDGADDLLVPEAPASTVTIPIRLDHINGSTVTVDYEILVGSTQMGADWQPVVGVGTSGKLTFTAGSLSPNAEIQVAILNDDEHDPGEYFQIRLSNPVNGEFPNGESTWTFLVYIDDDDLNTPPTLTGISDQSVPEDHAVGPLVFSIGDDLTDIADLVVTVDVSNPLLFPSDSIQLTGTGTSRSLELHPMANDTGTTTVIVRVFDGEMTTADTFVVQVTPVNDAPVLSGIPDTVWIQEDDSTTIAIQITDVDNATGLTITSTSNQLSLISNAGMVWTGSGANRSLHITPVANQYGGPVQVILQASDGTLIQKDTLFVIVRSVNDAPSFVSSILTLTLLEDAAPIDTIFATGILVGPANESTQLSNFAIQNSNPSLFSMAPKIDSTTGMLSFTLAANAHGLATLQIQMRDNGGFANGGVDSSGVQTITVQVTSVPDAPIANNDVDSTAQDTPLMIPFAQLLSNDTDADLDPITIVNVWGVTQGSIVIVGTSVLYTPPVDFSGIVEFSYFISDGALFDTAKVRIGVDYSNGAPTLALPSDQYVDQEELLVYDFMASDMDTQDSVLYFEMLSGPTNLHVDSLGHLTWTPSSQDVDDLPYSVVVRVVDLMGYADTVSLRIFVENIPDAPELLPIANDTTAEDSPYQLLVKATDEDLGIVENESLEYLLDQKPAGMTMHPVTGLITWTPDDSDVGVHTIRVMVIDRGGLFDTLSYQLWVSQVNDAPTLTIAPQEAWEDSLFTLALVPNDPENDPVTMTLITRPSGMILVNGEIRWTPDNEDVGFVSVVVEMNDHQGGVSQHTIEIQVHNTDDLPVLQIPTMTITENSDSGTVVGVVTATDEDVQDTLQTYFLVGTSEYFEVRIDGTIHTLKPLDYESTKAETLYVAVHSGTGYDTAQVIVQVQNQVEKSTVEIIQVTEGDSIWYNPKIVYTNEEWIELLWEKDSLATIDHYDLVPGINTIIVSYKDPANDTEGRDTVWVYVSTEKPIISLILPPDRPQPAPNTVVESPVDTLDNGELLYYINSSEQTIYGRAIVITKDFKRDTIAFKIQPDLKDGLNVVTYTYTDDFGNTATDSVQVFLDRVAPVVKIQRPMNESRTTLFVVPVEWTVDGMPMDTLNQQSLLVGENWVIRIYRDRAGNEGRDTVLVHLKEGKRNISLTMEQSLVQLNPQQVSTLYGEKAPTEKELFGLSFINVHNGQEEQMLTGAGSVTQASSGEEPYSGLIGKHLGPTVRVEVKLTHLGGVDAAGNMRGGDMQSIVELDGRVALSAGTGEDRKLVSLEDYVSEYCFDGVYDSLSPMDLLHAPLYKTTVSFDFGIFDAIGQFVDNMQMKQEVTSSEYLNDAGMLTAFVEIKPRANGTITAQTGRVFGSGAYLLRAQVKSVAILQCDLPGKPRGSKMVNADQTLETFGYMRKR